MIKYLIKHAFQYTLIFLILVTSVTVLFLLENRHLKRTALFAVAAIYPIWGIAHHLEEKNLTVETILEYLAITALFLWTLLATI